MVTLFVKTVSNCIPCFVFGNLCITSQPKLFTTNLGRIFIGSHTNGLIPHMSSKNDNNIAFYRNKTGFKEV